MTIALCMQIEMLKQERESHVVNIIIIIITCHHYNHCRHKKSIINNHTATINDYMRSLDTLLTHSIVYASIQQYICVLCRSVYMYTYTCAHSQTPNVIAKHLFVDWFNDNDIWKVCYYYYYMRWNPSLSYSLSCFFAQRLARLASQ